jgi:hypothetical protein
MLNGATQRSLTDPFDTTSPPIPIGPHWMIVWPFDAKAAGLSTVMRDAGAMVLFAGTPYAHLHICGSPWESYRAYKREGLRSYPTSSPHVFIPRLQVEITGRKRRYLRDGS